MKKYELIIIGGGITGATLAWEAAHRGLDVMLLEETDFASGTSANSMKTIHGGIRYLQSMNFKRTLDASRERNHFLKIAPHLVHPFACQIPTSLSLTKNPVVITFAIMLYNGLTINRNDSLLKSQCLKLARLVSRTCIKKNKKLQLKKILGGFEWHDGQAVNTERLVLSFLKSAKTEGAEIKNYCAVKSVGLSDAGRQQVKVFDQRQGKEITLEADIISDCSNGFSQHQLIGNYPDLTYVKAVNLIINRSITDCGIGINSLDTKDERFLFIVPWKDKTIVGTWYFEQAFDGPEKSLSNEQLELCLHQVNSVLLENKIEQNEIIDVHIGFLPASKKRLLKYGPDKSLFEKPQILYSDKTEQKHCIKVVGTKYTTARLVAEKTVNQIAKKFNKSVKVSRSGNTPLAGGNIGELDQFTNKVKAKYSAILDVGVIEKMANLYGDEIDKIMEYALSLEDGIERVPGTSNYIKAQVYYAIDHEDAWTLSDILLRRLDIGTHGLPSDETINFCADTLANRFSFSSEQRASTIRQLCNSNPAWIEMREQKS